MSAFTVRLGVAALLLTGLAAGSRTLWREYQNDRRDNLPWLAAVRSRLAGPSFREEIAAAQAAPVPVRGWWPRNGQPQGNVAPLDLARPAAVPPALVRPVSIAPAGMSRVAPVLSSTNRLSLGTPAPAFRAPVKALRTAAAVGNTAEPASAGTAGKGPATSTAAAALIVDNNNGNSPYPTTSGAVYGSVLVGPYSAGTINQTSGSFTTGQLALGQNTGSSGTYHLSGTGNLSVGNVLVGNGGGGQFMQSGGMVTTNGNALYLGENQGSNGGYSLSAGSLSTGTAYVGGGASAGGGGAGRFTQSGGTFTTNGNALYFGGGDGSSGSYGLSGGSLSTGAVYVGDGEATGTFTQTGGTFTTNDNPLYLGFDGAMTGAYNLNGGTLTVGNVAGGSVTSTFNFIGGTLQAGASSPAFFSKVGVINVQAGGAVVDTNGFDVAVAQNLLHDTTGGAAATDGGLAKVGAGTLTLTGNNTYTGPTAVNAGTLAVNGSLMGTGLLTVASGATLAGTGSAAGNVSIQAGGTFSPGGAGVGQLTLQGGLTLAGTAAFTLGGTTAGSGYTQAVIGGKLSLGGATLRVDEAGGFTLAVGQTFYLFDNTGTSLVTTGTFGNAPLGIYTDAAGDTFAVDYLAIDPTDGNRLPNDVSLTVLAVVPEPSTWAIIICGAGLLSRRLRRRLEA